MADTIRITAALRIKSSPELVRQQYRDIDHHIRNNVPDRLQRGEHLVNRPRGCSLLVWRR